MNFSDARPSPIRVCNNLGLASRLKPVIRRSRIVADDPRTQFTTLQTAKVIMVGEHFAEFRGAYDTYRG
jgi:hypothetical protein